MACGHLPPGSGRRYFGWRNPRRRKSRYRRPQARRRL